MKNVEPLNKMNKMMKPFHQLEKLTEPFTRIQNMVEPFRIQQQQINSFLNPLVARMEHLNKFYLDTPIFNNPLRVQLKKIHQLGERLKELFDRTPESLLLLAEFGWYLDYESEIALSIELGNLISNGEIEKLNDFLVEYYRDKLDDIIKTLEVRHSDRRSIIEQIESAHNSKLYFVSITCTLSQVDGICSDFTEKKFFLKNWKNDYLPQITEELTKISNMTTETFLLPLTNQTPIMAHESILERFPIKLNRHAILHGIDKNYGTEINSLKCLSLLKYMSDVLMEVAEIKTNHSIR